MKEEEEEAPTNVTDPSSPPPLIVLHQTPPPTHDQLLHSNQLFSPRPINTVNMSKTRIVKHVREIPAQDIRLSLNRWTTQSYMKEWRDSFSDDRKKILHENKLYHLAELDVNIKSDRRVICALLRKWRCETHSFHMGDGEITITDEDVYMIMGLDIEGEAPLLAKNDIKDDVFHELGILDLVQGSFILVTPLINQNRSGNKFKDTDFSLFCYIALLVGMFIAPGSKDDRIRTRHFRTIYSVVYEKKKFAWGAIMLAHIYDALGMSAYGSARLQLHPKMFMVWVMLRFPELYNVTRKEGFPLMRTFSECTNDPKYDSLDDFVKFFNGCPKISWVPYRNVVDTFPRNRLVDCKVIGFGIVVEYLQTRVLRQFGEVPIICNIQKCAFKEKILKEEKATEYQQYWKTIHRLKYDYSLPERDFDSFYKRWWVEEKETELQRVKFEKHRPAYFPSKESIVRGKLKTIEKERAYKERVKSYLGKSQLTLEARVDALPMLSFTEHGHQVTEAQEDVRLVEFGVRSSGTINPPFITVVNESWESPRHKTTHEKMGLSKTEVPSLPNLLYSEDIIKCKNQTPNAEEVAFSQTEGSTSTKRTLSSHNKTKLSAMEHAKQVQANLDPGAPSFVKSLYPVHVSNEYKLGLPSHFCNAHLPRENLLIALKDEKQGKYMVKYLWRNMSLTVGWKEFSVAHELVEGDALVFQLVKPLKLQVHIVKANSMAEQNLDAHQNQIESSIVGKRAKTSEETAESRCRSEEVGSEVLEGCRSSGANVEFKDMKCLENFTIAVNGSIIDSELSEETRSKYYELCCCQSAFLHDNLLDTIDFKFVAGLIVQTISISEDIRASKLTTPHEQFAKWDTNLGAFEQLGMNVGFLRARIKNLVSIISESEQEVDPKKFKEAIDGRENVLEETKSLKEKLGKIEEASKTLDTEIETLEVKIEQYELKFRAEADAPW